MFFSLFMLLFASVAIAEEPSFDFKGIALGSSLAKIEKDSRFTCKSPGSSVADSACVLKSGEAETIAGVPVSLIMLSYYHRKLESMSVTFAETGFASVVPALIEKYGNPTIKTSKVQNRMGASFENRNYTWRRGSATLTADRFSTDLATSMVWYVSDFYGKEFARRQKAAVKKKAGDL